MNASPVKQKKELDKKLVRSLNQKRIPSLRQLRYLVKVLNKTERLVFNGALIIGFISLVAMGVNFYLTNFIPSPAKGGEYTEGLIGAPQYINPLLAQTNDVDTDISRLVFSGLMRFDANLQIVPDLAQNWEANQDNTEFTFTLKENIFWHDGTPITVDDVIFTLQSIQDPDFRSPLLISLRGVTVEKIDERTIRFKLSEKYPAFLEVMTFGILPEHIWGEVPAVNANLTEYNLKPVGSGAWKFKSLTKDRLGNIKSFILVPYDQYHGPKPYIDELTFKFYPDFESAVSALNNNSVDGISFLPKELKKELIGKKDIELYSFALPQYTAVFFNQKNNEALTQRSVRRALAFAVDKPKILTEALKLEGAIIDGPILPDFVDTSEGAINYDVDEANDLLDEAGWQRLTPDEYTKHQLALRAAAISEEESEETPEAEQTEIASTTSATTTEITAVEIIATSSQPFYRQQDNVILEIKLTTVNQPETMKAAELIKNFWEQIGVKVNLDIIEANRISRTVIKPRDYQALLFGVIVGSNPDPYPFWHSSQAQDPGLNLSLYANRNADTLLETARTTADDAKRQESYQSFQNILNQDLPAIFLYNPTYTYAVDKKIKGINTDRVIIPADRFNDLHDWYIKTKRTLRTDTY